MTTRWITRRRLFESRDAGAISMDLRAAGEDREKEAAAPRSFAAAADAAETRPGRRHRFLHQPRRLIGL